MKKRCSVDNCERPEYEKGYCTAHYRRWLDTGSAVPAQPRPVVGKIPREARIPHGTQNGYSNYMCRCDDCRRANSDYQRKRYTRKCLTQECENMVWVINRNKASGYCIACSGKRRRKPLQHGTETGYKNGCRCTLCQQTANQNRRDRRKRSAENAMGLR